MYQRQIDSFLYREFSVYDRIISIIFEIIDSNIKLYYDVE
ncbi:hypothetical protein NLO413_0261 [Candidatus Neoehrlichia lotoris str. RAC413]|uniref:Uncharacterized protein n=1 Tax=Candidatus Neoehrlichia procyonis str. RAC413 TaxID=1359163 RepID=A0A0F3NM84_9RICK|nr:hypothetical protein NLO413_0261 [Candidatus Neoehrlichia lotoris str. RAC413]